MSLRRFGVASAFLFLLAPSALPQSAPQKSDAPSQKSAAAPDYSQEPFVFEQFFTRARFENDGTGERELRVRVRVQSDAGVQQLGQLVFPYNLANEQISVRSVRVHKADGTVVIAAADAVKDLTAQVARDAPVYTDTHEKHVTVPALAPGETLEYDIVTRIEAPYAPREFWFDHNFVEGAIVLDERLEINLPRSRAMKLKTLPGFDPQISEEGDRRIYRWSRAVLERPPEEDSDKKKKEPKPPAVRLSTFTSWDEVGRWYAALERDRVTPTPELRAKAQELTQGRATDLEKIEAIYDYVAKNIRYVSLSFGAGRYQPHAAGEVLANQYGDCKDKHTLLAALLAAVGFHADAALIPLTRKLDPGVPSPSQFDHLISAVPRGDDLIWLDTTPEVAPFRMLISVLRRKQALLVSPDGAARLVETPADPPFLSTQVVDVEGEVSELGKLTARVRYTMRGDTELALRIAFRRTPPAQWKQLGQTMALLDGFRGEISEVKPSDPAATREPFHIEFKLTQPNFLDWSEKKSQVAPPLPAIGLPDALENPDEKSPAEPVELGTPLEVTMHLKLALPPKYAAQPPVAMAVMRDYAEYRSRYLVESSQLTAERAARFHMRELPAERLRDYLSFEHAVRADEAQSFTVESSAAGPPSVPADAKLEDVYDAANAAYRGGNYAGAVDLYKRVVELEPKHATAWSALARTYNQLHKNDDAIQAARKQLEVNPYNEKTNFELGIAFYQQEKYAEATAAYQKQLEITPLDGKAHGNLGLTYLEWKKYAEAAPELEKATTLLPDSGEMFEALGDAYLNLNQKAKAIAAFEKAVQLDSSPGMANNVAYQLALKGVALERAQPLAEAAVAAVSARLASAALDPLKIGDLQRVNELATDWDTLGWIHFKRGDLDQAQKLILASWQLAQLGEVGDHLGQIYEKCGKKNEATRTYAQALGAVHHIPETRARLAALLGGDADVNAVVNQHRPELSTQRTLSLGKLALGDAQAEFYVLLAPGPKVEAVKFIKGDEKLRSLADRLRALNYPQTFPDATPTKIIRRGILSCSAASGECSFVLLLPEDLRSVD